MQYDTAKWAKQQKPAKNEIEKKYLVTGYTYACNSLTIFEYGVHAMTGNGSYLNSLNFAKKNS